MKKRNRKAPEAEPKKQKIWCVPECPTWGGSKPDDVITVMLPAGELTFCKRCLLSGEVARCFKDDPLVAEIIDSLRAALVLEKKGYTAVTFKVGQPNFLVLQTPKLGQR
jgi:hypothetical protein